jgi:hypothetical protein
MRELLKIVYKNTRVPAFLISRNSNTRFEVLMGINLDCCLLGCGLSGERLPTFQKNILKSSELYLNPEEGGSIFLQNVCNLLHFVTSQKPAPSSQEAVITANMCQITLLLLHCVY